MTDTRRGQTFMTGLVGGAVLGAAAAALFAPQIVAALNQIRRDLGDCLREAGDSATEAYRDAVALAGDAAEESSDRGDTTYIP